MVQEILLKNLFHKVQRYSMIMEENDKEKKININAVSLRKQGKSFKMLITLLSRIISSVILFSSIAVNLFLKN